MTKPARLLRLLVVCLALVVWKAPQTSTPLVDTVVLVATSGKAAADTDPVVVEAVRGVPLSTIAARKAHDAAPAVGPFRRARRLFLLHQALLR